MRTYDDLCEKFDYIDYEKIFYVKPDQDEYEETYKELTRLENPSAY